MGIPRLATHILRSVHISMVIQHCCEGGIALDKGWVVAILGNGRHGIEETKAYSVVQAHHASFVGGVKRPEMSILGMIETIFATSPSASAAPSSGVAETTRALAVHDETAILGTSPSAEHTVAASSAPPSSDATRALALHDEALVQQNRILTQQNHRNPAVGKSGDFRATGAFRATGTGWG